MTVRVTAAPGCHFIVTPHPSGLPGLRPLTVHGGDTAMVTEARRRRPMAGATDPAPRHWGAAATA